MEKAVLQNKAFILKSLNASVGKWAKKELGNSSVLPSCRHTDVHVHGHPPTGTELAQCVVDTEPLPPFLTELIFKCDGLTDLAP